MTIRLFLNIYVFFKNLTGTEDVTDKFTANKRREEMLRLMKLDKKTAVFLCGMNKKYYLCSIVAAKRKLKTKIKGI